MPEDLPPDQAHAPEAVPAPPAHAPEAVPPPQVALATIIREWGRIGCIGFGGPPAHIALLRKLCVTDRGWLAAADFEDGIAACNLLPGPASTQLAIYCAWRLRGAIGALAGGFFFIAPGLVVILGLSAVFLAAHPPGWIGAAAAGADAAVPAVALAAAAGLVPASWGRAGQARAARGRWAGVPAGRGRRGGDRRPLAGPGPGRLRVRRDRGAGPAVGPPALGPAPGRPRPGAARRRGAGSGAAAAAGSGRGPAAAGRRVRRSRRAARRGLGRAEGRRAVLRRRLRDHPAHAA